MAYDDNITNLYNAIKDDYEIGTEDDFRESLQSAENRHTLYEALSGEYELGTEDDFNNSLGSLQPPQEENPTQTSQRGGSVPVLSAEDAQFLPGGMVGAETFMVSPSPALPGGEGVDESNESTGNGTAVRSPLEVSMAEDTAIDKQFASYVAERDKLLAEGKEAETPYDKMVVDLLGSGAAETPIEANNTAIQLTQKYLHKTASNLASRVVGSMDADKADMGAAINEAWYRRDVLDAIMKDVNDVGAYFDDYVRRCVRPALQWELSRRYGYSDETAQIWANWLTNDIDEFKNRMYQQEAMQIVAPYAENFVDEAFRKVDTEANEMWQGINANTPTYTPQGVSANVGTDILGLMRQQNITDPQRVWDELLEPNLDTMITSMTANQTFWESCLEKAAQEGMDPGKYAEYRIAPVIEAMVYNQWHKTGVAREMPKDVLEYVTSKISESLPGMVVNAMINSQTRRRMQQEAMARTETGTGKYQPGFTARVAGGTAAMAPDIMLGVFKAGSLLTRGGATAMARSLLGKETFDTLGERMVAHGLAGSAMFGAVDAAKGATEAALDGGSMSDIFSRAWERAKGGMLMGASMVGGPLGQAVANGGNAMRVAAGALTGITLDATAATALGAGEELFANGEIDTSKLPESFVENWLTFGLLQGKEQGKNLYGAVRGERTWNGVKFNASEVRQIEGDEAFGEFRKVLKSLEKENKKGYIEELLKSTSKADTPKSRIRDLSPEQKQVVKDAAAEAYESVVYNPDILSSTKAKLSQAMQLPLPPEVYGEAEYFDPIYEEDGHYVLMSRNRYGQAVGEMRFRSAEDAATMRDKVEQEWMSQAEYMSGAMERSAAAARVYANLDDRVNDEYLGEGGVSARLQRKQQLEAKAQLHERDKKAPALTKAEKEELESLAPTEHEQNLNWIFANNRAYEDAMAKQERGEQLTDAEQQIVDAMNEHVISVANDYIDAEQQSLRSEFGVDGTDVDSLRDYAEWLRDDTRESAEVMKEEESPDPTLPGEEEGPSPALPEGEGENDAQEMPIMPENDRKNESPTPSLPGGEGERPDVASRYDKVVGDDGVVREVTLANGQKVYLVRQRTHDGAGNVIDILDEMNNEAGAFTAYDINGNVGRFRKDAIADIKELNPTEETNAEAKMGRPLTEAEAQSQLQEMKEMSVEAPNLELTPENWISEFGESGIVNTPIGDVKMGENQYFKMALQGRNGKLGMVKPTLESPDIIVEDERPSKENDEERSTSYVFVKTFSNPDGSRYYHFTSVTVSKEGKEVVISNQEKSANRISRLLQTGKVAWINSKFSSHPKSRVGESVPVSETNRPTSTDNQSALLGISSPEPLEEPSADEITAISPSSVSGEAGSSDFSALDGIGKDTNNSVNPQEKSKKSVAVAIKKVVNKAVGRTYETVAGDGHRVELELQGYDKDGNVKVRRTDYQANGDKVMTMDVMDIERVAQALTEKTMKPVKTVDDKLREAMGKTVYMKRLIDVLTGDEKQQLWDMYESASRRGDAGRQDLQEMVDELREAHFEDYVERQRADRQSEVEAAMTARPKERLNRLRKAFYGYEEAMLYLDDAMMEPQTIEEYAANYLGGVPAPGRGFIEHDSLVAETGHGRRRIGSDSRGYGPYLSAKGEGGSINEIAHGMWEELPEHLKEQWSDQDCKNALLEVLTSAERPSDIANYILKARAESAEEAARHEEDMLIDEHGGTANKFSLKRNQLYEAYETEQGTVDTRGGLVGNATAERVLSPGWRGALHALGRNIGKRIEVLTKDEVEQRWPGQGDNARGVTVGDTIYLNEKFVSDNENLRQFIMGHEMTHTIKRENDAKVWKAYVEAVKAAMGDAFAEEFNETRAIYDKRYKEMNRPLLSDEAIEEEVCCDWAGAHMLTDEKAVHAILDSAEKAGADPVALSKQILDWIKDTLRSLHQGYRNGTVGADEIEVMENARRLWQDMYDVAVAKQNERLEKEIEENMPFGPRESFSLRKDKEPEKTGVGYKVFVLKDGKLYPPMVANPGGEATPIGVWLDADAAPVVGVTKTGRMQVKAGGKGTQGGSGKLAYRPGWHLGEIPYASQFNRINPETGKRELFPANFVWAEVEYANDVNYQEEAMSYGMSKNGKFNHSLAGLPKVPKDGAYMYRTNPDPKTDPWIITGAMRVNRVLTPSEVDEMVIKAGREPQARQYGAVTDKQVNEINGNSTLTSQGKGVGSDGLKNSIQGLDGYSDDDVLSSVRSDIEAKLSESGLDGVTIKGMALHGSRKRGDAREDSDLDVVVEYEGDISEDGLFNILNEEPLAIEGIRIDINPIKKCKSGTLDEYMRRSREYDALRVAEKAVDTEPTDAQKEAGNYKKGHVRIGGFDISIEQPKGSVRSGVDADGKPWSVTMNNTYGYIRGTEGVDGDHIDVFLSDHIDDWNGTVYVVDQVDKDGNFDEHKVMYGFNSLDEAREAYMSNYSKDWQGLGTITGVSKDGFRKWVDSSHRKTKAFADYKNVSPTSTLPGGEGEKFSLSDDRRRASYAVRQWRRAHNLADSWVKKLNLGDAAEIYDSITDVPGYDEIADKQSKGWYDEKTGKIVIVMGNHNSPQDVLRTILRESVARHGLRKLFGTNYDTFLDNVYDAASSAIREDIAGRLGEGERSSVERMRHATEGYLAELAENTDFERADNNALDYEWFGKIKRMFLDMLHQLGIKGFGDDYTQYGDALSDNELRYILWRSYQNLADPGRYKNRFRPEDDVAMRDRLGLGEEAKVIRMGHIEDEIPMGIITEADEANIRQRVSELSLDDARAAYKRVNEKMLDDELLDIDEHTDKVRRTWIRDHGYEGLGKAMSSDFQSLTDKYGGGMITLRWELRDHIYELEGERLTQIRKQIAAVSQSDMPMMDAAREVSRLRAEERALLKDVSQFAFRDPRQLSLFPEAKEGDLFGPDQGPSRPPLGEEKEIPEKVTTSKEKVTTSIRGDVSDDVRRVVAHFPMETPEESASFDKRVGKMSDAELLAYMEADGNGDVNKAYHPSVYDEYDYRHGDELADAYDRYLQSLHDSNTTLEQAEEMLGNLRKDLARLATDERAELLGQEEALQEYVEELENESPSLSLPGGEGVDGKGDLRPVGHGAMRDRLGLGNITGVDKVTASRQSGHEGNGERFSVPSAKEQEYIKEKDVRNIVIDSAKERLPKTRTEALAAIPQGGVLYHNDDQSVEIRVGKKSLRHSNLHDNDDICKAYGKIGEIIRNAVKIGEEAPKADEKGHTHSVSIYYVPVNIDGAQYSARMVVKQYENKDNVLDEFSLYNIAMHKEKATPHTNLNATGGSGVQYDTALSAYKVKELIHSTQENDQKLLGIDANSTKFSLGGKEPFYSPAERAVRDIKQEKATGEQWIKMLEKNGGLKKEEDKWMGLSDFLKGKKSVTKDEVLNYIRENKIEVYDVTYSEGLDERAQNSLYELNNEFQELISEAEEETGSIYFADYANWALKKMVERYGDDFEYAFEVDNVDGEYKLAPSTDWNGDISDAALYYLDAESKPIDDTRLEYTTDGLENKREIALVVPSIEAWNESDTVHFGDAGEGRAVAWVRFGDATIETTAEGLDKDKYTAVKAKDRVGYNVYRPNGSEYGYIGSPDKQYCIDAAYKDDVARNRSTQRVLVIDEIQSKRHQEGREKGYKDSKLSDKIKRLDELNFKMGSEEGLTNEEYNELNRLREEGIAQASFNISTIPDAPFRKNWHELAMKRMLRYAAENGYDKIAWTKGEQQAERYNIGNMISGITVSPSEDGTRLISLDYRNDEGYMDLYQMTVDDNGKIVSGDFKDKLLSDVVGKDMSAKMMAVKEYQKFADKDLRIGGEGMKGFYDVMLPRFMDKYGKRWGVKTGEVEISPYGLTMWSVDVTPEMRESVLEGQPMFSFGISFKERQRRAEEEKGHVMPGLNDAQVKVVDVPRHSFTGTGKQAIEKARIWANENLVGSHTAHQIGNEFEYSIDEDAVKKFLSSSSTLNSENLGVHLAVLTKLPDVIDSSIEVEEHPDYMKVSGERKMSNGVNDANLLVHRMYGAVKIDNKTYRVKTTMHEHYKKGNAPHDYRVTKIELLISGSPTSNALSNSTIVDTIPLAKLLKDVEKSYDSGKKILEESKKIAESAADGLIDELSDGSDVSSMEQGFEQFSIVRRPTNNQRKEAKEKRMEERRLAQAKAAALDAGIREPSREQYEARAHREWVQAHRAWEQAPDASAEPNEWDFEVKAQKEFNEARKRYEEKLQEYMSKRSDELTADDVIDEREQTVHTPAQRMTNKIVDVMATERDPLSARDEVKGAVIQRRKDIEEISADDSIYINNIRRESDKLAMKLNGQKEKEDQVTALIRGIRKRMGVDKDMITGKDIREALPFLIEAEMRRRDIADEANMELQGKGSPARLSPDDIKAAEDDINGMRDDANRLLAVQRQMEEEGRITMSDSERQLRDDVYQQAHQVANIINRSRNGRGREVTADDIMATLSIVIKRVMPDGLKLMEYKDSEAWGEVQSLIGSIKDWYAVAYGWLEDAGLKKDGIGYYKDYVNHVWDRKRSDPEAWDTYVANRQPTTSKNMRKREIRTLMDGLELGLVPKYDDIADLMGDYSKSNILAWANKKMLRDLSFIDIVERGEDGEVKAMVPMLSTKAPNAFEIGKYDYYEIPGVGSLWVHKAVSKNFGLVFESYQPGKMMGTYDKFASIAKNIELAWSGFHAAALSEVYVAQNIMHHPVAMTRNFWKYLVKDALVQGQPPAYTDPELYKDAAKHLVKLGATGDYAPEALKDLSSTIKDGLEGVRRSLMQRGVAGKVAGVGVGIPEVIAAGIKLVNEGMDKALWSWLHDGLKLCQYQMFKDDIMAKAEKQGWDQERIDKALDEAGQYINDEFGGQHFEVISISPKTLRRMRRFLLSPDWLLSTQRHFLGNFGFGSIYNKANMRSFMDFYKNVWKRGKGNEGQFDGRYFRAKESIACYGLGVVIMYPLMMNALNALMRKMDEEYELEKEKEIEGYVSKYRRAYPNGMKGFEIDNLSLDPFNSFNIFGDYGMGGNSEGKKSHLFFGRYGDDTEMYIRWGKQFREFPELLENEQGDPAFPSPLLKRLMGKSNPNIRFLYDALNYYTRWDKSKNDEDLEDKWRKWIGDGKFQRNFAIPMAVGSEKLLQNYMPFWAPTQSDKEWKPSDMILPSTKGFTPYKARNYFTQFIKVNDVDGIKETFKAAVLNGMTQDQITRAYQAAEKTVQNESRDFMEKDGNQLQSVVDAFDASNDLSERKQLNSRIRKMLAAEAETPQTWDEFWTAVEARRDGTTEGATKATEKYLMVATSDDILEDARLAQLKKKAAQMKREHDEMKDNKADQTLIRKWEQKNQKWLDVQKIINDGESGSDEKRGTLYWKKKLKGDAKKDAENLQKLREKRKALLKEIDGRLK